MLVTGSDAVGTIGGGHLEWKAIEFARPNLVFVATPNNPTSNLVSLDRLEALIEAAPEALVIVDEAYIDFAPRTQLHLRMKYPNVAVMRTLSKVGFASLRVGWLIGPAYLVREIDKTRQPYNLSVPSQRGATFVLDELGPEVERMCAAIVAERARLGEGLAGLGMKVTPSDANFLWVETTRPAGEVYAQLKAQGVLVKSFHERGGRLAHRLRITVGLPAENDRLLPRVARADAQVASVADDRRDRSSCPCGRAGNGLLYDPVHEIKERPVRRTRIF